MSPNGSKDLPAYLFVEISRKIAEKRAQGIDVITFGIGDPDLPTPAPILAALHAAADDPANHRYPESEGLSGAATGDRRLDAGALRPDVRPRDGDPAADRREGGHRPHRAVLHRAGRRGAGAGPRLSGVRDRDDVRRGRVVPPAAQRRERLAARLLPDPGRGAGALPHALDQLPQQPDRRDGQPRVLRRDGGLRQAARPRRLPRQRLQRRRVRRLRAAGLPCRPRARATWAWSSSRSARPST